MWTQIDNRRQQKERRETTLPPARYIARNREIGFESRQEKNRGDTTLSRRTKLDNIMKRQRHNDKKLKSRVLIYVEMGRRR